MMIYDHEGNDVRKFFSFVPECPYVSPYNLNPLVPAQFYAFIKFIKSNLNVEDAEVCLLLFKSACKPLFSFLAFARCLPLVFSAPLFIVAEASTGCLDVVEGLDVGWPPLTAFKAVTVSRWQTWQT